MIQFRKKPNFRVALLLEVAAAQRCTPHAAEICAPQLGFSTKLSGF
jgi:hypothetical protein